MTFLVILIASLLVLATCTLLCLAGFCLIASLAVALFAQGRS